MSRTPARPQAFLGPFLGCMLALACSRGPEGGASAPDDRDDVAERAAEAAPAPTDARRAGPPSAEIEWPAEHSSHRTVRLDVRGTAQGVEQVFVNGRSVPVGSDGRWSADVELAAGLAEIVVHAPPAGEGEPARLALRQLVVDLEAPVIALDEAPGTALDAPPGARLVGGTSLELVGRVDDRHPGRPDTLTLDDEPCELAGDGSFRIAAELAVEGETTLRLAATDAAGNRARLALVVVRDTTPPTLDVTPPTPAELERRTDDRIVVRGRVVDEHPGRLIVDGEPVELLADGSFELELDLGNGALAVELVAEDAAGNRAVARTLEIADGG
jgi:hypothetical protein